MRDFARGPDEVGLRLRGPSALDRRLEDVDGVTALLGSLPAEVDTLYRLGAFRIFLSLRERVRRRRGLLPTLPVKNPADLRPDRSSRPLYPWEDVDEVLEELPLQTAGVLLVADLWTIQGRSASGRFRIKWLARAGRVFRPVSAWKLAAGAVDLEVPVRIDPQVEGWLRRGAVVLTGSPYHWPGDDVRVAMVQ